jgi:subfamily B ATP-binding cassette protein MsbA
MKNRTVIVIAHRLQTVMEAHKIIVLEKWKIIETWTHSELIAKKWVYSKLVDLQRWVINE